MKTLDEVIDNFEKACDLERRCEDCSGCLYQENGCPNDGAESIPDALHYLKEYKNLKRTAKVIEHDASITDIDGYKYHRSEYLCGACKKRVIGGDEYCSHCGCRLDWSGK